MTAAMLSPAPFPATLGTIRLVTRERTVPLRCLEETGWAAAAMPLMGLGSMVGFRIQAPLA